MTTGSEGSRDPRLAALIGIVAISFSGVFVPLSGVSASTSAFFRGAYALPALALFWWFTRQDDPRPSRERWLCAGAGVALGIDLTIWHHSIGLIGVGLATVIANLQVVLVGLIAWLLLREAPAKRQLLAVPVALVGVTLTSGLGRVDAYGQAPILGAGLALGAALFYAAFLLVFRQGTRSKGPTQGPLLDATLGVAASTLFLGLLTDPSFSLVPTWPGHGWLLLLALGAHTVGWLTIATALPRLPALTTSILLLLQPMLTMLWGVLIFAEAPSAIQWLGVGLVLGGVLWASLGRAGTPRPGPRDASDAPARHGPAP